MYVVIVRDRESDEPEAYGPYRSFAKAKEVRDLFRNPGAIDYRDVSEYSIFIATMQRYGA